MNGLNRVLQFFYTIQPVLSAHVRSIPPELPAHVGSILLVLVHQLVEDLGWSHGRICLPIAWQ